MPRGPHPPARCARGCDTALGGRNLAGEGLYGRYIDRIGRMARTIYRDWPIVIGIIANRVNPSPQI